MNRGAVIWSTSLPKGAALHTLRGAAVIIYRATIGMKLDESS
jgi:hypothetical protein